MELTENQKIEIYDITGTIDIPWWNELHHSFTKLNEMLNIQPNYSNIYKYIENIITKYKDNPKLIDDAFNSLIKHSKRDKEMLEKLQSNILRFNFPEYDRRGGFYQTKD
jgi:hypothetical protein